MGANQVHEFLNQSSKVLSSFFEAIRDNQWNEEISEFGNPRNAEFHVKKQGKTQGSNHLIQPINMREQESRIKQQKITLLLSHFERPDQQQRKGKIRILKHEKEEKRKP